MAITFVAAGANGDNGSVGSGNPTAPGIPAGMQAGDFMLLVVHSADNVTTSTPAGWTLKQAQNAGTALRQTIFWRRWQSGDAAPTIAHAAGDACQARIYGFRGVSTTATDPIEAIATQAGTANATVTAASITTVSDGAAVVGAWAEEVTGNTSGAPTWASYQGTNPTFAEIGDNGVDNLNANELAAGIAWGTTTPAGTVTGTRTAVVSGPAATPTNNIGTLLALSPPSAAVAATTPTPPLPRAFQEQGRIYSVELTGFQPLAFQIPDPSRAFQETDAFQPQAFQLPDPTFAFQPEGFQTADSFQMSVIAFQEPSGFQGNAFQESTGLGTAVTGVGQIGSAEAFGTTKLVRLEQPIGITSAEAFGTTRLASPQYVSGVGQIASAEAFGTTKVLRLLQPVALASAEAFGAANVRRLLQPVAIASAQAFGTTTAKRQLAAVAITSSQAFGSADKLVRLLQPVAIASSEAFGTPTKNPQIVRTSGIASAESFGTASISGGAVVTTVVEGGGQPSVHGVPHVAPLKRPPAEPKPQERSLPLAGISSAESFGICTIVLVDPPTVDADLLNERLSELVAERRRRELEALILLDLI